MGTKTSFKCNQCGYTTIISGGHDCGMLAVTDTYMCKTCKNIVDVCVGEYGKRFLKDEIKTMNADLDSYLQFYKCPVCESEEELVLWNNKKRPCPRCDGKLEDDATGMIINWD
jgi:hypothetical protein